MNGLRLLFVDSIYAYRALFRWLTPAAFIPSVIGVPAFQLVLFVWVGSYVASRPPEYYAVGNVLHSVAMAGLFATAMMVGNERQTGTLSTLIAAPAPRAFLYAGRVLPPAATGVLTAVVMLALAMAITPLRVRPATAAALLLAIVVCALSASACGLLLGVMALRTREINFAANLTLYLVLLLCGVNFPTSEFPRAVHVMAQFLPLTHGIEAARRLVDGAVGAWPLLATEVMVGAGYLSAALVLAGYFERRSRVLATLDLA